VSSRPIKSPASDEGSTLRRRTGREVAVAVALIGLVIGGLLVFRFVQSRPVALARLLTRLTHASKLHSGPASPPEFLAHSFARPNIPDISCSPATRATIWNVPADRDFQYAIDHAAPGDIIQLRQGQYFTGPFTLANTPGDGPCITIRTSAPDSALPPPGTRITPAYASLLPKIVSPGSNRPALQTAPGAHHYQFMGVEFHQAMDGANLDTLVALGTGGFSQRDLAKVPHHLVFDRVYIHGLTAGVKHCVTLNSASTTISNSHISDCKIVGFDAQAILGHNGPGPFRIINNYLEASGENLMFGGADPTIQNLVPSDIEVRRNHFSKPLSWKPDDPGYAGTHWTVKNLLELKNAQRVLVEGNVFDSNWSDAQAGYAILFTPRNENGYSPWSVVQDVTFTSNIIRHASNGLAIQGADNHHPSQTSQNILIANNVFEDIGGTQWGGANNGHLFLIVTDYGGPVNVVVDHNTAFHRGGTNDEGGTMLNVCSEACQNTTGFVFTNNIAHANAYVIHSPRHDGTAALSSTFASYDYRNNVIIGPWPTHTGFDICRFPQSGTCPSGDRFYYPQSDDDVRFVDRANGNYRLQASSGYHNAGTDGRDTGVDVDALNSAQTGTVDHTAPAVSLGAPIRGMAINRISGEEHGDIARVP
jgi:hypothetical protein